MYFSPLIYQVSVHHDQELPVSEPRETKILYMSIDEYQSNIHEPVGDQAHEMCGIFQTERFGRI